MAAWTVKSLQKQYQKAHKANNNSATIARQAWRWATTWATRRMWRKASRNVWRGCWTIAAREDSVASGESDRKSRGVGSAAGGISGANVAGNGIAGGLA